MLNRMAIIALSLAFVADGRVWAESTNLEYNRDVRPILSDKCFFCHGPDKKHREANLRLDVRESALEERDGVRAIVPGDLKASDVVYRIETQDADDHMPPEKSHKTLTKDEIAILKAWVKQGAPYQDFWAYDLRASVPVPKAIWRWPAHNEIDRFVQRRLKQEKLKPSPEADRVTLARRVHADLIGLPPSPADVDAFVADKDPLAYERMVDRLLASERYGERLAIMWLDLVRYADTVGYHGDQPVSQSPYRDYVINAFNQNMSYDQFTREQLAGDLIPNATENQKIASAYNRLNMTTEEGGSQAKEFLAKYASDRVRNVSAVWMGATVGCAECHDHKYDPITAKDFYSFAAFFADLKERGVYGARKRPPEMSVLVNDAARKKKVALDARIAEVESLVAFSAPEVNARFDAWVSDRRASYIAEGTNALDAALAPKDILWIDDDPVRDAKQEGVWSFVNKDDPDAHVYSGNKARKQTSDGLIQHFFTVKYKQQQTALNDDLFYAMVRIDTNSPPNAIMLQVHVEGSWEHRAYWGDTSIVYGRGDDRPAYRHMGDLPDAGQWVRLEASAETLGVTHGKKIRGFAFTQFGGTAFWDDAGIRTVGDGGGGPAPAQLRTLVTKTTRTDAETEQLQQLFVKQDDVSAPLRAELETAKSDLKTLLAEASVTVPVSEAVTPREIRLLPRGDWMDDSGEIVQPAVPEFLGTVNVTDRRATRADLADWFMSDENPLTARVFMNNLWGLFFGTAISRVQEDLGGQGEWPSHVDLLDWLAVDFRSHAWDIKRAVKQIVMSHTYRQSSVPRNGMLARDPHNRLLQRQSRFPLQAELLRDNALAVSGLLVNKVGGPSARPYQPAGYYRELNFPKRKYKADAGDNQYRRGVYTWWQRTFLHPSMKAFDAPSREACTASRPRSNTPLQALALMNDPTHVEAARVFAVRIINEGGTSPDAQIKWAYHQAFSKAPDKEAVTIFDSVYQTHRAHYLENTKLANELVRVGDSTAGHDLDAVDVAAWTSVSRVMFNLHEFIARN